MRALTPVAGNLGALIPYYGVMTLRPDAPGDASVVLDQPGPGAGMPPGVAPPPAQINTYPLRFTGTAEEYFRIWIVNLALTVVTLGIYTPWARVRTRQYFYGHTWLDGHNFEYTASPMALLRGYLIVAFFFGTYSAAVQFQFDGWEWVVGIIVLLFAGLYPWLVRQTMRFQARSTLHRGLHFRFLGTLGEAYLAYGLANVAAGLSGALALPWAWFMQRRYQIDGVAYGNARGRFRGDVGQFYLIGFGALAVTLGGGLLLGLLGVILVLAVGGLDLGSLGEDGLGDAGAIGIITAAALFYLGIVLLYGVAWQYVRAATMHYVLNHLELGGVVRTRATFSPWRIVWINVTNVLARIVSLGLLTPWAAIRLNKYTLEHIQVRTIESLDNFSADQVEDESALGEAATELLDINLGF